MKLEKLIREQQAAHKPVRIVILKARQVGMSTWIGARFYDACVTEPNITGLIAAHDSDSTEMLFDKVRTYQEVNPFAPPTRYNSKKALDWRAPLRSWLRVQTAGKIEIGRSETLQRVHLSEFAFWPDAGKSFLSVAQTVPDTPATWFLVESTANGLGGAFYELYQRAKSGQSEWAAYFFAWWEEPTYTRPIPAGDKFVRAAKGTDLFKRYGDEEELVKTYGLNDEQLNWRRWCIENKCGADIDKFRQEYPANDVEAFQMSGHAAFDMNAMRSNLDWIERQEREGHQPKRGRLHENIIDLGGGRKIKRLQFIEGPGYLRVWKFPHPAGQYVLGTDVSEGRGGDPAGTVVMHKRSLQDVADLHGQFDPDELAVETDRLRRWYNDASCCFDATGVGQAFLLRYKQLTGRIYFRMVKDKLTDKRQKELGYKIAVGTRETLVAQYSAAVREGETRCRCREALQEHFTFVVKNNGKAEHQDGCHDDHVFKRMLALEMIKQEPWLRQRPRVTRRGGASVPGAMSHARS